MFKGIQISGSFGPNAVVETGGKRVINIAGGSISGDFYREVPPQQENDQKDYFVELHKLIDGMEPSLQSELNNVVALIETPIRSKTEPDISLVDLVLTRLQRKAPEVFGLLAKAIVQQSSSQCLRQTALDKLSDVAEKNDGPICQW